MALGNSTVHVFAALIAGGVLVATLGGGGDVTITVVGELEDGRAFFGSETVRVTHAP